MKMSLAILAAVKSAVARAAAAAALIVGAALVPCAHARYIFICSSSLDDMRHMVPPRFEGKVPYIGSNHWRGTGDVIVGTVDHLANLLFSDWSGEPEEIYINPSDVVRLRQRLEAGPSFTTNRRHTALFQWLWATHRRTILVHHMGQRVQLVFQGVNAPGAWRDFTPLLQPGAEPGAIFLNHLMGTAEGRPTAGIPNITYTTMHYVGWTVEDLHQMLLSQPLPGRRTRGNLIAHMARPIPIQGLPRLGPAPWEILSEQLHARAARHRSVLLETIRPEDFPRTDGIEPEEDDEQQEPDQVRMHVRSGAYDGKSSSQYDAKFRVVGVIPLGPPIPLLPAQAVQRPRPKPPLDERCCCM